MASKDNPKYHLVTLCMGLMAVAIVSTIYSGLFWLRWGEFPDVSMNALFGLGQNGLMIGWKGVDRGLRWITHLHIAYVALPAAWFSIWLSDTLDERARPKPPLP